MDDFKHIAIIGVGLMGGSLALALKKNGCKGRITGIGRSEENLIRAQNNRKPMLIKVHQPRAARIVSSVMRASECASESSWISSGGERGGSVGGSSHHRSVRRVREGTRGESVRV